MLTDSKSVSAWINNFYVIVKTALRRRLICFKAMTANCVILPLMKFYEVP